MEVWKKIKCYDDYEFSSFGRVKSLKFGKERILKQFKDNKSYLRVDLVKNEKVHQLIAIAFLGHKPCGYDLVVNHKDFNRENNHIDNLEIITARENCNKKHLKSKSQYVGVTWYKRGKKNWRSRIQIKNKNITIGYYKSEIEAHNAYQYALNKL